jgi:uncharacterized membrane protein
MRQTVLTLVLIFSLAFNIAFVGIWVYSRTVPRGPEAGPSARAPGTPAGPSRGGAQPPWEALQLSAERERRIRENWRATAERIRALNAELEAERDRLFELFGAEEADEPAIAETQARIESLQAQVRQLAIRQMMDTRRGLSPAQRRELFQQMRARGAPRSRPRGRAPHGRGQPPGPRRGPAPDPSEGVGFAPNRPLPQDRRTER